MISVSTAQLDAWLAAMMFPLARVLGMIGAAPLFSNGSVPVRVRLSLGLAIALAVLPTLPPMPQLAPGSGLGLAVMVQQILIGIGLGFVMRIVLAAVIMTGELIGLQMGLSFATFFDPQSGGQTAVMSQFLNLLATLLFLALKGHLLMIDVLVRSFEWLPVSTQPLHGGGWMVIARLGALLFSAGLLLALPLVATLLITNIAMGVLTRAAPQLNLFAIGFPVTLSAGFLVLLLSLDSFAPVLQHFFGLGFDAMAELAKSLR